MGRGLLGRVVLLRGICGSLNGVGSWSMLLFQGMHHRLISFSLSLLVLLTVFVTIVLTMLTVSLPASFTFVEYCCSFICTSHLKLVEHHLLVLAIRTFFFNLFSAHQPLKNRRTFALAGPCRVFCVLIADRF